MPRSRGSSSQTSTLSHGNQAVLAFVCAGVIHEFNNLSTALSAAATVVDTIEHPDPRITRLAKLAHATSEHVRDTVRTLLAAPERTSSSKLDSNIRPQARLSTCINRAIELVKHSGFAGSIEQIHEDPQAMVAVDQPILVQVLLNVLLNSHRALTKRARVSAGQRQTIAIVSRWTAMPRLAQSSRLRTPSSSSMLVLDVIDHAGGIHPQVRSKLQAKPNRAKASRKTSTRLRTMNKGSQGTEGNGIGLSVSQAMLSSVGARLSILSRWGVGTTVRLELPLAATGVHRASA